jgi:hypothetical protein
MTMKSLLIFGAALFAAPLAANAQTAPAAPAQAAAAQAAPAAAAALNGDTPIETLAASAAGKASLEKQFPNILTHPAYEQFKAMSLRQLAPLAGGIITDEKIAALEADLAPAKK